MLSFDRRIPKLDVAGSTPVSRSNFFNDLQNPIQLCAPSVLHLHHRQTFLQLVDHFQPAFDRRLRIDILVHVETMTELVGHQFSINAQRLH